MKPVLSLTSSPVQTVQHNSRTLSMDPERIHFSGSPCLNVSSVNTVTFINLSSLFKDMGIEENSGEYLNTKNWVLLDINRKSDSRGRIHIGEKYFETDIRVFVSDLDQEPETCKQYMLLPKSIFTEVRKSRIKEQAGEPLKVQSSGDVWMGAGNKNKFVKVFVRK